MFLLYSSNNVWCLLCHEALKSSLTVVSYFSTNITGRGLTWGFTLSANKDFDYLYSIFMVPYLTLT